MWFVIQTLTGKEKELVEMIDKILVGDGYNKCFVIRKECVWRIEGTYHMHIEPLFSSYVFVDTKTPEYFFFQLKKIPRLTKLLGGDGTFWTVKKEEQELLEKLMEGNKDYIVRRSHVQVDPSGEIVSAKGALQDYLGQIVKKRLRKRSVMIEIPFLGETRRIQLAIWLDGDGT